MRDAVMWLSRIFLTTCRQVGQVFVRSSQGTRQEPGCREGLY